MASGYVPVLKSVANDATYSKFVNGEAKYITIGSNNVKYDAKGETVFTFDAAANTVTSGSTVYSVKADAATGKYYLSYTGR